MEQEQGPAAAQLTGRASGSASSATLPRRPGRGPDLAPLFAIVEALRRGVPRELQDQFNSLLREVLLTLRALIDWYLERLDRGERKPEVEEIRID